MQENIDTMVRGAKKKKLNYYEKLRVLSILGLNSYIDTDRRFDSSITTSRDKFLEDLDKLKEFEIKNKFISIEKMKKDKSYRGYRHKENLPCNGQRTHTNSKTRRKHLVK